MGAGRDGLRGVRNDAMRDVGGLIVDGDAVLGADDSQCVVIRGSGSVRHVNDDGMAASPGTTGELVYNEDDETFYACSVGDEVAATWVAQKLAGAIDISGDVTVAGDATVSIDADCRQSLTVESVTIIRTDGGIDIGGSVTLGESATDKVVVGGVFVPRTLWADPATAHPAGKLGELAYYGGKAWVCVDETPGNTVWDALN